MIIKYYAYLGLVSEVNLFLSLFVEYINHEQWIINILYFFRASHSALVVKNLPANAGDIRDLGSIPGLGRSPAEEHDNPLQYPCLENPMDRGVWWATANGVTKSQT